MLTSDLAMSWRRGRSIGPRLLNASDPALLRTAEALVSIVSANVGETRGALETELDEYIGSGTDYRVLRGLIKLLMDRCTFETVSVVDPFALRRKVFERARDVHPVPPSGPIRDRVLADVAEALVLPIARIEEALYADLEENQRLVDFADPGARELLENYNVAQAQALLYRAIRMEISIRVDDAVEYRALFDAIKAYRLIHTIGGDARSGYEITLDGPVSLFHRSQKYGVQMAVFLPALLERSGWRMRAEIDVRPKGRAVFELDSVRTELRSPDKASPRDRHPAVEKILAGILKKTGSWRAEPATQIVDLGDTAFVPDLVVRHDDGTVVFVEVVGFWTPKSLAERLAVLERAPRVNAVLAVSEELRASRDGLDYAHPMVVVFKSAIDLKQLGESLDAYRATSDADLS